LGGAIKVKTPISLQEKKESKDELACEVEMIFE